MPRFRRPTRRQLFQQTAIGAAMSATLPMLQSTVGAAQADPPVFRFALNTSTIRGQKKTLPEIVEMAAEVGYDGIEPWIRELEAYRDSGGDLEELRRRIESNGLEVISAIGFPHWCVDDANERKKGLEQAKRDMALVRSIGGDKIAAPPVGATDAPLPLDALAERFAALAEVGRNEGVQPQLELWGHSQTLHLLGEVLYVACESKVEDAAILPDVFHLYKGGSGFHGLHLLAGTAVHLFHINDYPADPPRERIRDGDRVFPGDGVAPLEEILRTLATVGFRGFLSLELFNADYWKREAVDVCREGLEKTRRVVERAMSGE